MKPENLVGRLVKITDGESPYYGHWGFILDWDGDVFHISGGSISSDSNCSIIPIFDRGQFKVPNRKGLEVYKRMYEKTSAYHVDDKGFLIKK